MATELGQAYVQIIPSAKGISGSISKELSGEAASAGKSAGLNIVGAIKGAIVAAGIGKAIAATISEGGALQQSIGGIETLFKDNADKVRKYANEAYKTVGVGANEYMENVTSFSASLLQSMGGDTEAAADKANMAMIDMGDNANKMGSDMRDIQNAYQGFAKQNYTMLDNLKLGYGGTKTEMERLLADATKLSGVEYNIANLDDVYSAIHVVQEELGITGTTAKEASETITGSFNAMKSSFTNVLGALAIGEGLGESLKALAETLATFLFDNLLPMLGNIISALPGAIVTFIQAAGPAFMGSGGELISTIANGIITGIPLFLEKIAEVMGNAVTWLKEQLPLILQQGIEFISNFANGIFEGLPSVITSIGEILRSILLAIWEAMPTILASGIQLIFNLAKGLWDNLPAIIEAISNVLASLVGTIIENYPEFLKKGLELIGTVAIGIVKAIPEIVSKIPQVINALLKSFSGLVGQFKDIGVNIIKGLWEGINSVKDWILGKISGFVDSILGGIKSFFGINSPSTLMADEVGKWLPPGIAEGIEGNMKPVANAMESLAQATIGSYNIGYPQMATHNTADTSSGFIAVVEAVQKLERTLREKNMTAIIGKDDIGKTAIDFIREQTIMNGESPIFI